jgi:hypothetical protein
MNRRPPGLQLSIALQGFLQYKNAEGLSQGQCHAWRQGWSEGWQGEDRLSGQKKPADNWRL